MLLGNNVVPPELDATDGGVFAKTLVPKGTRYGPFQGKWAGIPHDARFAWEVSHWLNLNVHETVPMHMITWYCYGSLSTRKCDG